jgi:hypothetical protein
LSKFSTAKGFHPVSVGEAAASVSGPQDHRISR